MTQTPPIPENARDSRPTDQWNALNGLTNFFEPFTDSASDNDASERAAREKLKKTSIASISQHAMANHETATAYQDTNPKAGDAPVTMTDSIPTDHAQGREQTKPDMDASRGRPVLRKRSFDDLEAADAEANKRESLKRREEKSNGHARKRSRDVRVGGPFKEDGRSRGITVAVEEEAEDITTDKDPYEPMDKYIHDSQEAGDVIIDKEAHDPMDKDSQEPGEAEDIVPDKESQDIIDKDVQKLEESTTQEISTPTGAEIDGKGHGHDSSGPVQLDIETATNRASEGAEKEISDHEMRDSTISPRKKRSRDQFDADVDREQKIAATEETRAHRRSDEIQRGEDSIVGAHEALLSQVHNSKAQKESNEVQVGSRTSTAEAETKKIPSIFGSPSILAPPVAHIKNGSPGKTSTTTTPDQPSQTSASAFASSGFATLSKSATSPFGTVGATSATASTSSPSATASPFSPRKGDADASKNQPSPNCGFSAFAKTQTSGFGAKEPSPFGTTGAAKPSVFGGSIFGSGFGGGFGGGGKLVNFAAPTGDAKLGNGTIKPIGSPTHEGDDEENSETDGEGFGENGKGGVNDEADERFQHQDVETGEDGEVTIFSARASLYAFREKAWKESGKGNFKLNVIASSSDDDSEETKRTGRFIMRAHQTYRVLLNALVFKGMVIGDGRGNEPTQKSFAFGVVEEGRLIPHMIKLGDVTESRTLFREVRRIQEGLAEP